ncbi:unnamed protein product [Closterium sp. NIES-65]|nr:unnamed protein product [Closterium sp. NIES-65]
MHKLSHILLSSLRPPHPPPHCPPSCKLGNIEATEETLGNIEATEEAKRMLQHLTTEEAKRMLHHLSLTPFPSSLSPSFRPLSPPFVAAPSSYKLGNIEATEEAKRMLQHLSLSPILTPFSSSPHPPHSYKLGNIEATEEAKRMMQERRPWMNHPRYGLLLWGGGF